MQIFEMLNIELPQISTVPVQVFDSKLTVKLLQAELAQSQYNSRTRFVTGPTW